MRKWREKIKREKKRKNGESEAASEYPKGGQGKGVVDRMIIGIGTVLMSRTNSIGEMDDEISLIYAKLTARMQPYLWRIQIIPLL